MELFEADFQFHHCNGIHGVLYCLLYVHDAWNNLTNEAVLTFADCPVASVARLTGAAVASDHVKAQGILVAVVESAEALVMLWRQKKNTTLQTSFL